jgi:hypothetical protein
LSSKSYFALRGDGVLERGGLLRAEDGGDLAPVLLHRDLERRLELLDLHPVEGRHSAIGARPGLQQRVGGGGRGGGRQGRREEDERTGSVFYHRNRI